MTKVSSPHPMRRTKLTLALILISVLAAMLPAPATAESWVIVYKSTCSYNDCVKQYVDRDSIRTMSNGNKRALVSWRNISVGEITLVEYDCDAKSFFSFARGQQRFIQRKFINNGQVNITNESKPKWYWVGQNGLERNAFEYVCGR